MRNLTNRLKKLEYQKGSVFILYSYPYGATEDQVETAQREAITRYMADGGDPDLSKTLIGIIEFSNVPKGNKWFYVS